MNRVNLYPYQQEAIDKLQSGYILCAGVGSGKSITALAYYYVKECQGSLGAKGNLIAPKSFIPLYIITTARKRDTLEWDGECSRFGISKDDNVVVDSWNNIHKYKEVVNSFFIFDEQRVVGSGTWVKNFIKISKKNRWILLSATPGDTWVDYVPVFIANGFYKNRTSFLEQHAVYSRYSKFPKIDRFVGCGKLETLRRRITVTMDYVKKTISHHENVIALYDKELYHKVMTDRWNPFENEPIQDVAQACYLMRKVVNSHPSRLEIVRKLMTKHPRLIIFYNHDHELEDLRTLSSEIEVKEWNGHFHQPVPNSEKWIYLVQYMAGAEAWNCIVTDAMIFYSQSYSYKMMTQAAGRIDRTNTPYTDLYYYHVLSLAPIDKAIQRSLKTKKNFNQNTFFKALPRGRNSPYYEEG